MFSYRKYFKAALPLLVIALLAASGASAAKGDVSSEVIGTLTVQRHGDHGRPVILIPGLEGGPWVWQRTIAHLQKTHVVYALTLAGFDGMPAPADGSNLFDRADASLLRLIKQKHIDKPVLIGHSIGGTLALRFAGEHADLIAGVVAVDGLPVYPGMDRMSPAQRKAIAAQTQRTMAAATPAQFKAPSLQYMQHIGLVNQQLAARYAPMNARSDVQASAHYMAADLGFDGRALLQQANVPILEISPYYAPDFSHPPMMMSQAQKAAYYQSLLANAPHAKVVSISRSRHFVMLDQPQRFQAVLDGFLKRVDAQP